MASKKTTEKNRKMPFWNDERFRTISGIALVFLSLLMFLAFFSYLFTWKTDQSFEWQKVFSGADLQVENWSGKVGAWLGNTFMNQLFGLSSFGIPFLLFLFGVRFLGLRLLALRKTVNITLSLIILSSLCLSYLFKAITLYPGSGPGGRYGYLLTEWLNSLTGVVGTGFILLIACMTFVFVTISSSLPWFRRLIGIQPAPIIEAPTEVRNDIETEEVALETEKPFEAKHDLVFETEFIRKEEYLPPVIRPEMSDSPEEELELEEIRLEEETDENFIPDASGEYDPTLELSRYQFPSLELLEDHVAANSSVTDEELIGNKNRIVETLGHYKIQIDKIKATIGPTITLYEIVPAPGVRISKIKGLEDDIALSLSALGIRIIAPMPGKGTIGIEVPNQNPDIVSMKSILSSKRFQEAKMEIPIALGKTISNETYVFDLTKMPHLLVAGATGQGKSVGLNAIIASMLYKKHPSQLKLVLVDPKKVELTLYSKIERHFLATLPDQDEAIITDTQKVIHTLISLTMEMDNRYDLLKRAQVRNIKEYNAKFVQRKLNPEKGHRYLPYIVVIIDEFADLIMTAGREVENPLARLAQLARAIGIHLVIATQRPTTNIITGTIKANFPARIAFRVSSGVDSKTILDTTGANQLIGRGDMLISGGSDLVRLQCAFIDIPELDRITDFIGNQQGYPSAYQLPEYVGEDTIKDTEFDPGKRDEMFEDAARLVVQTQQGSTSLIQRKFSIGYNRAGRIMDQLEAAGVVGPFEGSKARQVLFPDEYSLEQFLNQFTK